MTMTKTSTELYINFLFDTFHMYLHLHIQGILHITYTCVPEVHAQIMSKIRRHRKKKKNRCYLKRGLKIALLPLIIIIVIITILIIILQLSHYNEQHDIFMSFK